MDTYTLITGSTSGIGLSIAHKLYPKRKIILHGRNQHKLDEMQSIFPTARYWTCDFSTPTSIESSLYDCLNMEGIRICALIHCAGIAPIESIRSYQLDKLNLVLNTNLLSAMLLTHLLTAYRFNSKALESIVFISSNISGFGAKGMAAYSASKGGLDGFMKSIAMELAPRVRVNSVLPGAIRTPLTENIFNNKDVIARLEQSYPLGLGKPEDIANAVDFLLSDTSRWITGHQLIVDGGRTANLSA